MKKPRENRPALVWAKTKALLSSVANVAKLVIVQGAVTALVTGYAVYGTYKIVKIVGTIGVAVAHAEPTGIAEIVREVSDLGVWYLLQQSFLLLYAISHTLHDAIHAKAKLFKCAKGLVAAVNAAASVAVNVTLIAIRGIRDLIARWFYRRSG